jgi:isoleucyl-tRNA synthetase
MFDEVSSNDFAENENTVLEFWNQENVFQRSIDERKDAPCFTTYDGPPFATGLPHYGHLLAGTIKDVLPRYKTMKGYRVPRRFGWDCHGLPVENEIEKAQNLSGAPSIESFGIPNFNEECRKVVMRYSKEWKSTVLRMGRWVDFDRTYHTMDLSFMESVWWVFKQLYDKGLVYEGFKVMPFSAKLGTPLSNFEATQNYKEVDDPALTVAFPMDDDPNTSLLIWTTTPWTLISNLAIAVGPEIDYVKLLDKKSAQHYILAKGRIAGYYKNSDDFTIVEEFKGKTLEGKGYKPVFSYFKERKDEGAFRVLAEEFVSVDDGTGLVHMAPAFGEQDFFACQNAGIEIVSPVNSNGQFEPEIAEYSGQFVKDADKDIARRIKADGRLFHQATIRHRYPFCWRSDTPLIYLAVGTWFVAVEKIKDDLLEANSQIQWVPSHIKEGRFGKWLAGARDWAISRNRYWGTPIPLWMADDGEIHVIGSVSELEELTGESISDIHRHYVDQLTFTKNGKVFRRIPEVFDCWFESGSMPYAQNHYPFENAESFEKNFPADFIAEGLDQTRGWFYTLTVLAAALFKKPAFKNVIVNGIILAEDGNKMSKRLKNYPDPMLMVDKYGADAIRLYMLHSPAVKGDDLCFTERGIELVLRQVMIPWWNAYKFFLTYARIYKWTPNTENHKPNATIDQWILSRLNTLIQKVESGLDQYELSAAVDPLVGFIDQLTNWYIRRSRRRFWDEKASEDRDQALGTLYQVLLTLSKLAAPFAPFVSETMYRNLRREEDPISVHLCNYPAFNLEQSDSVLEDAMEAVQKAVSMGHSLRKEHKLKVRQPLQAVYIVVPDQKSVDLLKPHEHLIAEELNVKELRFSLDETAFVTLSAKPNFRTLGKKVGKMMKSIQQRIQAFSNEEFHSLMNGETLSVELEGQVFEITPDDVGVVRNVKEGLVASNSGQMTVVLDTTQTEALKQEGLARELVNKINTMRRDLDFDVTDRIKVCMHTTPPVQECFSAHSSYICAEVLAIDVSFSESCDGQEWDLNGEITTISLSKV